MKIRTSVSCIPSTSRLLQLLDLDDCNSLTKNVRVSTELSKTEIDLDVRVSTEEYSLDVRTENRIHNYVCVVYNRFHNYVCPICIFVVQ